MNGPATPPLTKGRKCGKVDEYISGFVSCFDQGCIIDQCLTFVFSIKLFVFEDDEEVNISLF